MGGRLVRLLVLSALFLTFTANLIFVMQTRECTKETQIFPWIKRNLEIEVSKQEQYINVASRQENVGKLDYPYPCHDVSGIQRSCRRGMRLTFWNPALEQEKVTLSREIIFD